MQKWERLDRKTLVSTPFLEVFSDTVRLPDGSLIDDFTVVKKRDAVIVVATDKDNQIITFREYKYAADDWLRTLPAGQIDAGENPEQAGARELLEETGYGGGSYELIDVLCEYPTKDLHTITVVRARDVSLQKSVVHEATENIGDVELLTIDELRTLLKAGEWKITAAMAALLRALPELTDT
jgi:8-oxo-dGTP pyrophosphatase MutT (NUDIX family)